MKKTLKIGTMVIIIVLIVIQFFQPLKTNPPSESIIDAPPEALSVLKRSCFDCHSHETQWPWYSNIAPISWLLVDHVNDGRRHLNFSRMGSYDAVKKEKKLEEILEEVNEGNMPMPSYLLLHGDARLSDSDKEILRRWIHSLIQPK